MKQKSHFIDTQLDINETAAVLSVSPATIRNWMKAGKITPVQEYGNKHLFNKNDIEAMRKAIVSGTSHRLKSRRNKKAVIGCFIPTEYVSTKVYITFIEHLLTWINEKIFQWTSIRNPYFMKSF